MCLPGLNSGKCRQQNKCPSAMFLVKLIAHNKLKKTTSISIIFERSESLQTLTHTWHYSTSVCVKTASESSGDRSLPQSTFPLSPWRNICSSSLSTLPSHRHDTSLSPGDVQDPSPANKQRCWDFFFSQTRLEWTSNGPVPFS